MDQTSYDELIRLRIKTCVDVSAATLLAYDYLLTLTSEMELIWPSQWNLVKVLFLLTRYLPICDVCVGLYKQVKVNISVHMCHATNEIAGWMLVIGIIIAEVILVVRTWAIWGRGRRLAVALGLLSAAASVPVMVIEGVYLNSLVFSQQIGAAIPGCLSSGGDAIIGASFVIIIVFETFVLVLTLIKGYRRYRDFGNQGFIATLFRDGIVFFLYLFVVSVVNLIVIVAAPRDSANLLTVLQRVLHSSLSSRVLINLREAHRRERENPMTPSLNMAPVLFLAGNVEAEDGQQRAPTAATGAHTMDCSDAASDVAATATVLTSDLPDGADTVADAFGITEASAGTV